MKKIGTEYSVVDAEYRVVKPAPRRGKSCLTTATILAVGSAVVGASVVAAERLIAPNSAEVRLSQQPSPQEALDAYLAENGLVIPTEPTPNRMAYPDSAVAYPVEVSGTESTTVSLFNKYLVMSPEDALNAAENADWGNQRDVFAQVLAEASRLGMNVAHQDVSPGKSFWIVTPGDVATDRYGEISPLNGPAELQEATNQSRVLAALMPAIGVIDSGTAPDNRYIKADYTKTQDFSASWIDENGKEHEFPMIGSVRYDKPFYAPDSKGEPYEIDIEGFYKAFLADTDATDIFLFLDGATPDVNSDTNQIKSVWVGLNQVAQLGVVRQ